MNLRYLVAWLLLITLAPLVLLQAYRLRRTAIRLPPAQGPRHGSVPAAGAELRVLLMGESTVAGVGARNHQEALSGQLAAAIHGLSARSVVWEAAGLNGMVARETADRLVPWVEHRQVDVLILALGVNDVLALRSPQQWIADLRQLVNRLQRELQPRVVVLTAMPPVSQFPAIPQPLRAVFGLVAASLDQATRKAVAEWRGVCHAALPTDLPHQNRHFALDGFHPSPSGYALWSESLAETVLWQLSGGQKKAPHTKV